jgi:hypothetical protein
MLKEQFEKSDKLNIAKIAQATGLSYAMLLSKSRAPIEGVPYDPNQKNYAAMEALAEKHKVDWSTIDFEKLIAESTATKAGKLKIGSFEAGQKFEVRYFKATFEVVYATKEYVCILEVGKVQPKVLSYSTFNACGLKAVVEVETE